MRKASTCCAIVAKAIRYALSRWTALTRYTTDGRLEMTNNAVERAIRPLALTRKNYLFAGSDSGGIRAAAMYTLIESASTRKLIYATCLPALPIIRSIASASFYPGTGSRAAESLARQTALCAAPHRRIPSSPPMYS